MAETAPRLNSATDAGAARYAPLSSLALAAFAVGVLFFLVVAVLGYFAYSVKRPLLEWYLFLFPVVGLTLAFIARRSIRSSEGTLTGERYANAAWWLCAVGGMLYFAYWLATDWTIRSDAERQMKTWSDSYLKADPKNPVDESLNAAFFRTLEPSIAAKAKSDPKFFAQMGPKLNAFRNTSFLAVASRNRGKFEVVPQGLRTWAISPEGNIECEVAGLLKCDEGEFPLTVPMQAISANGERFWQIQGIRGTDRYLSIETARRTTYGWSIAVLESHAHSKISDYLMSSLGHPLTQMEEYRGQPYLPPAILSQDLTLDAFVRANTPAATAEKVSTTSLGRLHLLGGAGLLWKGVLNPGNDFFAREDGQPLAPIELEVLRNIWESAAPPIVPAGKFSGEAAIKTSQIEIDEKRILIRVPIEFKPYAKNLVVQPGAFCTGRLVYVLDDPTLMAEINRERAAQGPLTATPTPAQIDRKFPIRVLRIESDVKPMTAVREGAPPAGGPGG